MSSVCPPVSILQFDADTRSLGKRIKAALLCKTLPKDDNPAEYVNGGDNAPSRNLVTAIKLAGYVVHSGTGGKVSAVDGDGREVSLP